MVKSDHLMIYLISQNMHYRALAQMRQDLLESQLKKNKVCDIAMPAITGAMCSMM